MGVPMDHPRAVREQSIAIKPPHTAAASPVRPSTQSSEPPINWVSSRRVDRTQGCRGLAEEAALSGHLCCSWSITLTCTHALRKVMDGRTARWASRPPSVRCRRRPSPWPSPWDSTAAGRVGLRMTITAPQRVAAGSPRRTALPATAPSPTGGAEKFAESPGTTRLVANAKNRRQGRPPITARSKSLVCRNALGCLKYTTGSLPN